MATKKDFIQAAKTISEIENSQKYAVVEAQAMDYQEQLTKGKSLKEELEKLEINLETLQKSQEDM